MAGHCLIVANQTLGGSALDQAVEDGVSRSVSTFYVVVPMTSVEHEAPGWTGGFALGGGGVAVADVPTERAQAAREEDARRHEAALAESRDRAQRRLDLMLEKIESLGGQAQGEVGTDDPLEATRRVLEQRSFDEIIVSTLPSRLSRWLKMDLPNRVARLTDAPVTTIEADSE